MSNLETNINQAIKDFDNIKSAIQSRGKITINNTPTKIYGDLIRSIPVEDIYEVFNRFMLNDNIGTLIFPEGVTAIPNGFCLRKKSITGVVFPSTLESIGASSFHSCQIETLEIPKGVTTIDAYAFGFGILKSLTLPNTLTKVDVNAFAQNTTLTNVTLEKDFNCSINLQFSTSYSIQTLLGILSALADRTNDEPATLTLGSVNLSRLADIQKAVALNKNWILA